MIEFLEDPIGMPLICVCFYLGFYALECFFNKTAKKSTNH